MSIIQIKIIIGLKINIQKIALIVLTHLNTEAYMMIRPRNKGINNSRVPLPTAVTRIKIRNSQSEITTTNIIAVNQGISRCQGTCTVIDLKALPSVVENPLIYKVIHPKIC